MTKTRQPRNARAIKEEVARRRAARRDEAKKRTEKNETPEDATGETRPAEKVRRRTIEEIRNRIHQDAAAKLLAEQERIKGLQGEILTQGAQERIVPLDHIVESPDLPNLRQQYSEEAHQSLAMSLASQGLLESICVVELPNEEHYAVVYGFARTRAARALGWQGIRALVLPRDTPRKLLHSYNLAENVARKRLSTYETAWACLYLKQEDDMSAVEIAGRVGLESDNYVYKLLRCITKLPPEILKEWKSGSPLAVDAMDRWTSLSPNEAVAEMYKYCNRASAALVGEWQHLGGKKRANRRVNMVTARGARRIGQLRQAIGLSTELTDQMKAFGIQIVDFCSGATEKVSFWNGRACARILGTRKKDDPERAEREKIEAALDDLRVAAPEIYEEIVRAMEAERKEREEEKLREERTKFEKTIAP